MEMDLRIPIISRDQVKVTTLVILSLFSEEFQFFLQKYDFQKKIIFQKQKKQKIMKTCTFATLRRAQNDDIGSFPSNYGEMDNISPIIGGLLISHGLG